MPQIPFKLPELGERCYSVWSTVVDAPVQYAMTRREIQDWMRSKGWHEEDVSRAAFMLEATGVSTSRYRDVDDLIDFNRAGDNETAATREQIAEMVTGRKEQQP